MTLKLVGKKIGMTRIFNEKGDLVVCTVIHAEPNLVAQIKEKSKDGTNAVQLAGLEVKAPKLRNVTKPLQGHFAKSGITPRYVLTESKVEDPAAYQLGQAITLEQFSSCKYVDVVGVSKGKGYQGVIKRHNFAGGPASHGSGFHRHCGSTGMRTSPGRCLPGQKKAGRMGGEQVTVQSLEIVKVDLEKNVLLVKGAVPGSRNGIVYISKAKKK